MRTWKWMFTAPLLISLSAMAQQTTDISPSSDPVQNAAASQSATTPAPTAQPDASQPASKPATQSAPATTPSTAMAPPTTMDEVVDRAIFREHALMEMLKTRTPLVETYLQNLKPDPKLGPVPSEDHYFLGRLDLGTERRPSRLSFQGRELREKPIRRRQQDVQV